MASVDRLSTLPDHILCHILSFLPTKISVSTSILSTRWKSIWAHVPSLYFNVHDYNTRTVGFSNIISRVMSLYKVQTLNSLVLIYPDCNNFELETMIIIVMSRNMKYLRIELDSDLTLPRQLFTITTLVRLTLACYSCYYKTGGNVRLPCLKYLNLECIQCEVDEDLPRLLSGCPVLEDLVLDHVSFAEKKSGCFNVSSSALKRLTVIMGGNIYESDNDLECRLEINAPALIYLKVHCMSIIISVSQMTSLVEADIDTRPRTMDNINDHYISMMKFLNCLCHVKFLSLKVEYYEFVDMALAGQILRFDNLNKLVYQTDAGWHLFGKLLKAANNLKVLILSDFSIANPIEIYRCLEELEQVPACLSAHLRTIRILKMASEDSEHRDMVRYLLENAKVLERMEIYLNCHSDFLSVQRTKLVEFLSSFVRGSEACELVILRHLLSLSAI